MQPKYPIYIISKGRWESRPTSKALEEMKVPYCIVVEQQEYGNYAEVIDPNKILTLPFSNLGQGSIPARNWVWEQCLEGGIKRHWILDDNIKGFYRLNKNEIAKVTSGTIFKCAEDFVDRYENVAFAGFDYKQFTGGVRRKKSPFRLNTRIYSCILVNNNLPYRWRGLYNEDTDICLRALEHKWCTILFHAFIQDKATTMTMKGGNTDELYKDDGRLKMAQSLQEQHPDIVKIAHRFGRWQHVVDYRPFVNNKLIKKEGLVVSDLINNYGMILKEIGESEIG
jgi:hypothetical protein